MITTYLQGLAVGGGAELTTATDFRLVTPRARVAWVQVSGDQSEAFNHTTDQSQARMGVAPGWGGARRLVNIVGRQRALELMLSCR